ncbi:hypothetical protein AJ79_04930 [Helicocarpus griseus UAMH5409]|uniref:Gfd2/YDR514C-like C-terminal domain-containing protein n=1 Tax=Helicocarpus griseus UAMH5409 TaxID=1447875 RepID=A0A2B7XHW1_9EURO|nr:hypothetical protein AJ79_04930 [Helicocarpus griseus UAMH5409]
MDRGERLKLLFGGGDEELLKTNSGLQYPIEAKSPSADGQRDVKIPSIGVPQANPANTSIKPALQELSSSEDGFDEYLASFSQARKAKMKKKKSNMGGKSMPLSNGVDLSISTFSHHCDNKVASFCPIIAVSRFPYKYVRSSEKDRIAKGFFDAGKFWDRCWDLYYIHPPPHISMQPLVLVPTHQVQDLIDEINRVLKCQVSIPSDPDMGFMIHFEDDGTPQPQYLGTSSSKEEKEAMESIIPAAPCDGYAAPKGCSAEVDCSFAAFKAKMEAAVEAARKNKKKAKTKRQGDRIMRLRGWCSTLKRTQCYLGMRPRRPRDIQPPNTDGLSWDEQKRVEREYALACGNILEPFDVNKPAPFTFTSEPIFVCVDVEANEKSHSQITEIGVSTLDTLDLVGIPPGEGGRNWVAKINSRHFRISEFSHIVNKDFVDGCPDKFEFGKSEWIFIKDAADAVDSCFQPPYSARTSEQPIPEYKTRPRSLVFLGHDPETDLSYIRKLGCTSFPKPTTSASSSQSSQSSKPAIPAPHFLETLDTSILYRVLKRETEPTSLGKILADLSITGWNLHNGGNDARYTMEAMIGIALKSRLLLDQPITYEDHTEMPSTNNWPLVTAMRPAPDSGLNDEVVRAANAYDRKWKAEVERRVREGAKDAESRVRSECAGWDEAIAVEDDGGEGTGWGGEV